MTARVLVDPAELDAPRLEVRGERAHHLRRVARVRDGERVVAFDGAGRERETVVEGAADDRVALRPTGEARDGVGPDAARVTWIQAIPKGDKLETIARQATELGVARIVPAFTERSVPQERPDRAEAHHARLLRVVEEAARQCGRADVPEVLRPRALAAALDAAAACALRLVAWERSDAPLAALAHPGDGGVAVLSGPEGGLSPAEVALAAGRGFVAVSLGPRVLRAETVAPALLGALSARWGDIARCATPREAR